MNTQYLGCIVSLQVGLPRVIEVNDTGTFSGQPWTTGFFKLSVTKPVWLGNLNLDGDAQADLENHGGLDKAVNVYPIEHYPYWTQTLSLRDLPSGAFGENFTTYGLSENEVCIGDTFQIGESLVQVSQPRQPCWKLARRWGIKDLAIRFQETGRTGWYFRVLREGFVKAQDKLVLVDRRDPQWTVALANLIMHHQKNDIDAARELANCPTLSARWRVKLWKRSTDTGMEENNSGRLYGPNAETI
ncbi:MAG: MOSC domain-containing protein [Nitrospira sp.]|nr:MOSC domain-containing protein [Nitrospira sp.]MDH4370518.1 MOSC domain-containing protein [Nitrospira sp.]MDH5347493.1 MOSC domain-containing protein [Nitrospira sp.]MDH5497821.1 MOSC domain-containing protein [Nitrospira sp.]MDH5726608.1 MOSC domain-containing protein [Nitrospira sp.]